MYYLVILTCVLHKYFSINYYLITTFFSLETIFLLLKFWEKHVFVLIFQFHKYLQIFSFYENEICTRDTEICLFLHYTYWYLFQRMHQIAYTLQLSVKLHHSHHICQPSVFCIAVHFWNNLTFFFSHFEICIAQDVS